MTRQGILGNRASAIVFGIFVPFFALLTITSFRQKSPNVDEPVNLFAGYSYLKWGDYRVNPEHPPLAKMLAALPLLAFDIRDPRPLAPDWNRIPEGELGGPAAAVANHMLFVDSDAETLFFYARLPMIAFGIILGIFVYLWSKELFGVKAAIASLFIYSLDPNILAHSQIVHTDVPFTTFFFVGTYFFWRALSQLSWLNLLLTSLFFGLATITKYSYVTIVPIWGILGLVWIVSPKPQLSSIGMPRTITSRWGKAALVAAILVFALMTGYVFTWAAYGFRFHAIPGEGQLAMAQVMPQKPLFQGLVSFISQHHLFPEAWIYGQLHVLKHVRRTAYLLGQISDDGFWLYFPVAFAVKTPLPTLFLLIATVGIWIFKRRERPPGLFLVIPIVVYFSLALLSRTNIGLRHILPIYPFLFVLLGGTAVEFWKGRSWIQKGVVILLGAWYVWSSITIYPHHLAFFNELVGGAKNGHKVLLDSNLDWGQDLKGVKRWMDDNEVKKVQFFYFGIPRPEYYVRDALYLPEAWAMPYSQSGENAQMPNHLAISANHLYGVFLSERQKGFLKPFRSREPIATIGHSIFIYRIDEAVEHYRRAVKINPASAEDHHNLANLLESQRRVDEAIEHYRRVVQIDPTVAQAHNNLGTSLLMRGELEEAIKHLRKVLELRPLESQSHFYLGTALASRGNLDEAADHLQEALKIKPKFSDAHHNLGRVMAARGDLDRAIDHFREALRIEPEFADAHESLGRALAQQGKREEAVKHYQEALRILKSRQEAGAPG